MGALAVGLAVLGVLILQFPGTLALSVVSAALALGVLAWADRPALAELWRPRFWALTAAVALLAGAILSPTTHYLGPLPVSVEGSSLAAVVVLRAVALLAVVTLGVRRLTEARLVALAARLGLPALGSAGYRALALLPGFVVAGRVEWGAVRGKGRLARIGEAAVALLVRATRVAEGELLDGSDEARGGPAPRDEDNGAMGGLGAARLPASSSESP
jgi:hypothetical protein